MNRFGKKLLPVGRLPKPPTEKVTDYVNRLLVKAEQLAIDKASIFMIALNGLLPSIRNAVLQKGSKTLDELLQTATLFEVATGTDPTGQGEILKAFSAMQIQLERLSGPSVSPLRSRLGNRKVSFDLPPDSTPQENDEEASLSPTYDFVCHSGTQSDNQSQPSATHHRSRSLDRSFRSAPPSFRTAPPLFQSV